MNQLPRHFLYLFACLCFLFGSAMPGVCQGPPVPVQDTCKIATAMQWRDIPVPGTLAAGTQTAIAACPSAGVRVVLLDPIDLGKAKGCTLVLRLHEANLLEATVMTQGKQQYIQLRRQMVSQAGKPSKMVVSDGLTTYIWDLKSKLPGVVSLHYVTATQRAVAVLSVAGK